MPKKNKKRIIVTSALPYANGPIHIGHLVEYIQTDIFVRFLRLIGEDVVYCCADDTHGTPIEIKAKELGIVPEELIGRFHRDHLRDFTSFNIKFDSYYSTNSKENKYFSDLIFERLKKKNLIYQKEIELTYCGKCGRFLPDRYVKGKCPKCNAPDQYGDVCESCNATYKTTDLVEPYCVVCGSKPIRRISRHYFFKLSAFSDKLKKWLVENKNLQDEIKNYVLNWIKEGLEDWDISRDGPYFGFKIPNEENMYYYVWLDAPIGYISSFANTLKGDVKKAEREWNKAKIMHFIGKDITYFHFLFWPAMLIGADFNLPENIAVHGFLTVNKEKMSKSRGTFFTAEDFLKENDAEYLRFYYARVLSKKLSDIDLDFKELRDIVNNEMVANLGNFCYRTLSFLGSNFDGKVGKISQDRELIKNINEKIKKVKESYSEVNLNEAVREIMAISSLGNQYFQNKEPWKLVKEDKEKTHKIVGLCVNIVKNLSILIQPIFPSFSARLQEQLGVKELKWEDIDFKFENKKLNKPEILIKKMAEEAKEEFPLDLRVAQIDFVEDHPDADKLYVLKINLGKERRQLVAGLRQYYKKEQLLNKKVIVVANLEHAKLRGVRSEGMLLAADNGKDVGVLFVEKSLVGERVKFGNLENSSRMISFDNFSKIKMVVKDSQVVYNNLILGTKEEDVKAEKVVSGEVK
ncbi:methionine--tRNA ligase [Candidatus Woesearchaeota archaeon]|nr:methionine--tRNA ligase [Candidatus Woesearchaeota archaeon]